MPNKKLQNLLFLIVILSHLVMPLSILAQDNQPTDIPPTGFEQICRRTDGIAVCLQKVYIFALGAGSLIALLMIVLAGYRYMTAQGNAEQVEGAKDSFASAFIGLIIIFIAFILLYLINPDLVGFTNLPEISLPVEE